MSDPIDDQPAPPVRLNVTAQSFVPNPSAHSFVPGGGGRGAAPFNPHQAFQQQQQQYYQQQQQYQQGYPPYGQQGYPPQQGYNNNNNNNNQGYYPPHQQQQQQYSGNMGGGGRQGVPPPKSYTGPPVGSGAPKAKVMSIPAKGSVPTGKAKVLDFSAKPAGSSSGGKAKVLEIPAKGAKAADSSAKDKPKKDDSKKDDSKKDDFKKDDSKKKEAPEKPKEKEKKNEEPSDMPALEDAMSHASILNTGADEDEEMKKLLQESKSKSASEKKETVPTSQLDLGGEDDEDVLEDEEVEELEDESQLRRHVNIVFIGHVDAGKSTISGHIMYATGMLDDRTLEKFEREAKSKNRESWKFAWALDTTDTERAKGKTEEVGRAVFQTETKRYTVLDAPGHKGFVPHMIGGAAQADIAVLVISARKGEFETGFDRGGQTREHAMLAKTAGVKQLVVVINKMDDPTVEWNKDRYDEIVEKLTPYLKQVGYNTKTDVYWLPISGLQGFNLKERLDKKICPWYDGPSLLELLDNMKPLDRLYNAALRLPIADKYKDMGCVVMGKLESGTITKGQQLVVMPNGEKVEVVGLQIEHFAISKAEPGDNVKVKLQGVDEDRLRLGFVLCPPNDLVSSVRTFDAQIIILEYKSIICAGYSCVLHIHACVEECTIDELLAICDKKGKVIKKRPKFVRQGQTVLCRITCSQPVCVEEYKKFQQLGRFMIRDEGKTVGVGIITALHQPSSDEAIAAAEQAAE